MYKTATITTFFAIFLYKYIATFEHGTFLNPLNVTLEPLTMEPSDWWTDMYISGKIKLTPMTNPTIVNSYSEVAPPKFSETNWMGWGKDNQNGIKFYKMSPELYAEICPTWEAITEQFSLPNVNLMVSKMQPYGPNPIGCSASEKYRRDLTKEFLTTQEMLYFNSEMDIPVGIPEQVREGINHGKYYVSTFMSMFDEVRLTSPWHSAISGSVAVQCFGSKYWVFSNPRSHAKYGARGFFGATILRGSDEDEEHFLVKTVPGSILVFPSWWSHFVVTDPGKSYMYTVRYGAMWEYNWFAKWFTRLIAKDRLSIWNTFPPFQWPENQNGKTANEMAEEPDSDYADIMSPNCTNSMPAEKFAAMDSMHRKLLGEEPREYAYL